MKWTNLKPTKPGHYWARVEADSGREITTVVHVYSSSPKNLNAVDRVFWDGENFDLRLSQRFHLWSDEPIPEPSP